MNLGSKSTTGEGCQLRHPVEWLRSECLAKTIARNVWPLHNITKAQKIYSTSAAWPTYRYWTNTIQVNCSTMGTTLNLVNSLVKIIIEILIIGSVSRETRRTTEMTRSMMNWARVRGLSYRQNCKLLTKGKVKATRQAWISRLGSQECEIFDQDNRQHASTTSLCYSQIITIEALDIPPAKASQTLKMWKCNCLTSTKSKRWPLKKQNWAIMTSRATPESLTVRSQIRRRS